MPNIGVVGTGMWGINHVRVLKELEDEGIVKLTGINDVNMDRAKEVSRRFGADILSLDKLFDASDAVIISTPPSTHAKLTIQALENGLHVLVEKPMAVSMDEAYEMVDAAEKHGLNLLVGHILRYNPAVQKLREAIHNGVLGDPVFISAKRIGPKGRRRRDTGVILDLAIHEIDVIRYITRREPGRICSRYGSKFGEYEDYAFIYLDFEKFSSIIETNLLTPYKLRELFVTGTDGVAKLSYITQELVIDKVEGRFTPKIDKREPLKEEIRHFIKVIKGSEKPICDGYEGLKTLEIALAALKDPEMDCINR